MNNYIPTTEEILKAMEKSWEKKEEEFQMTELLLSLPDVCPELGHDSTIRDFDSMRWKCVTCGKTLQPRQ